MALSLEAAPATAASPDEQVRWAAPRTWPRGDRVATALLALVPVVLFVAPALAGHAAVVGDNLLQNYPLRVLAGRELAAGHWPTWNPLVFSGTPLLGGMNAGALYPGTVLFAVLPDVAAWVVNLLVVYWTAALGLYALARWCRVAPLAAAVAAATYAFSGAMVGQLVHIGVVQGQSLLPWLVLGQLVLARRVLPTAATSSSWRSVVRRAAPPTIGIAVVLGLVGLTGEPRTWVDALVVLAVVAAAELVWHGHAATATTRGRVAYAAATAVAAAWGIALALVQVAPGWGFVTVSERHQVTYSFFQSGSWPARWLELLVNPGLLGDNGLLGTPKYFASYNLPEVTGAVGLLALTAVAAAVARCASRGAPTPRRALGGFVALCAVGGVLALGSFTPLGHLLYHVPLLGRTRLQNRSMAIFDLGAAALLAWWLDAVLAGRPDEAALTGPRRYVTLAPLATAVALGVAALVGPGFVTQSLMGAPHTAPLAGGIRWLAAGSLGIAVAYLVALRRRARRTLVAVALIELACFSVFFQTGLISGTSTFAPSPAAARALFGSAGRTAIVDPLVQGYHQTVPLGLANLDVFTGLPSVQGYGSLESQRYVAVTGTERLGSFDGCALARGAFAPLRLAAIAVTRSALAVSPVRDASPTTCGVVPRRPSATRYLGGTSPVARVVLSPPPGATLALGVPTVVALGRDGRALRPPAVLAADGRALVASFPGAPRAAAIRLSAPGGVRLARTQATLADGTVLRLDTAMQVALSAAPWRFEGVAGVLSVFRATAVRPWAWLAPSPAGDAVRLVAQGTDGTAVVSVRAVAPARLVRAEAWLPGWTATLASSDAISSREVDVVPDGLVQAVEVPRGVWTVTFAYHAPHLVAGALGSLVGLVALVGSTLALEVARRRDRTTRVRRAVQ